MTGSPVLAVAQLVFKLGFFAKLGASSLILSAGMQRSGSTLMFNLLRLILEAGGRKELSSGYIKNIRSLPEGKTYLIKTHHTSWLMGLRSSDMFYSFRDVRSALVSQCRMYGREPNIRFVEFNLTEFKRARALGAMMVRYEDLTSNPSEFAAKMAHRLRLEVDTEAIVTTARQIASGDAASQTSGNSLFHKQHRTGTGPDDWRTALPPELAKVINSRYGDWFRECGYPAN